MRHNVLSTTQRLQRNAHYSTEILLSMIKSHCLLLDIDIFTRERVICILIVISLILTLKLLFE
jgi:hypothetical protein